MFDILLKTFPKLPEKQKTALFSYAVIVIIVYMVAAISLGGMMKSARDIADANHKNRMDPSKVTAKYTEGKYTDVKVGMYLEGIRNFSIADCSFTTDFYIWFSWKGDKSLNPAEHFQVIDGSIDSKELVSEHYDNNSNYQRVKVTASIIKFFDTTRISLEDHMLNIYIEDNKRDSSLLRFVPDEATEISSRVKVPGYDITKMQQVVKPHEYKTTYSSPTANGKHRVFSEYVVGISLNRSGSGFYLKILIPFLIAISLGLATLWSRPSDTDSRFGLAGAAFFGVVANAYIVNSLVPANGNSFGLLDILSCISLLSVFLIVATSISSLNIYDKQSQPELALSLDKVAFLSIIIGLIIFNIYLPFCAYLVH